MAKIDAMRFGAGVGACTLAASLVAGTAVADTEEIPARDYYAAIAASAARGDQAAEEALAAIDTWMIEHDVDLGEMPPARRTVEREPFPGGAYRLEGVWPWGVQVTTEIDIDDRQTLDAYVEYRHAALREIAAFTPDRVIEVAVTPADFYDGASFGDVLGDLATSVQVVTVDVWDGETWVLRYRDLDVGLDEVTVAAGKAAVSDLYEGGEAIAPEADAVTIHQAQLEIEAADAVEILDTGAILLSDTIADIEDRYGARAAIVYVSSPPLAFAAYAEDEFGRSFLPAPSRVNESD